MVVGAVPNPIALGVSIGVQILAGTGKNLQTRYRVNTYLQSINETLFMPHGLYCLIMTYKPDKTGEHVVQVDLNQTNASLVTESLTTPDGFMRSQLKALRLKDGVSKGELALPESAPLVYPALDRAVLSNDPLSEKKQNKLKSSQKFVADYFDRRSQASYAAMNPQNKLSSMPEKQFSSRWADPNHPCNNGCFITFISGGTIDIGGQKRKLRTRRAVKKAARHGKVLTEEEKRQAAWNQNSIIKRFIGQDVFYMMICNMPMEEEMLKAKEHVNP